MPANSKPLSTQRAWSCVLMNQAATPGLGSIMGRRWLAGSLQLALALIGFALLCVWIGKYCYNLILKQLDQPVTGSPGNWLGEWGLILFGASWLWSWVTSISLIREARAHEAMIPPRITNPPKGM